MGKREKIRRETERDERKKVKVGRYNPSYKP
jgi:hypothetical protein